MRRDRLGNYLPSSQNPEQPFCKHTVVQPSGNQAVPAGLVDRICAPTLLELRQQFAGDGTVRCPFVLPAAATPAAATPAAQPRRRQLPPRFVNFTIGKPLG